MSPHSKRLCVHLGIFVVGSLAAYLVAAGIVYAAYVVSEGLSR